MRSAHGYALPALHKHAPRSPVYSCVGCLQLHCTKVEVTCGGAYMLYLKQVVVLETVVVHWLARGMMKTTAAQAGRPTGPNRNRSRSNAYFPALHGRSAASNPRVALLAPRGRRGPIEHTLTQVRE